MNYFLAKTDPETYSIDNLARDRKTVWDGVRNAQALRAIREMRPGDRVFICLHRRIGEGSLRAAVGSHRRQTDRCGLRVSDHSGAAHHLARDQGRRPFRRLGAGPPEPPVYDERARGVCGMDAEALRKNQNLRHGDAETRRRGDPLSGASVVCRVPSADQTSAASLRVTASPCLRVSIGASPDFRIPPPELLPSPRKIYYYDDGGWHATCLFGTPGGSGPQPTMAV
jgi:hypothetical protein